MGTKKQRKVGDKQMRRFTDLMGRSIRLVERGGVHEGSYLSLAEALWYFADNMLAGVTELTIDPEIPEPSTDVTAEEIARERWAGAYDRDVMARILSGRTKAYEAAEHDRRQRAYWYHHSSVYHPTIFTTHDGPSFAVRELLASMALLFAEVVNLTQRDVRSSEQFDALLSALQLFIERRLGRVRACVPRHMTAEAFQDLMSVSVHDERVPRKVGTFADKRGFQLMGELYLICFTGRQGDIRRAIRNALDAVGLPRFVRLEDGFWTPEYHTRETLSLLEWSIQESTGWRPMSRRVPWGLRTIDDLRFGHVLGAKSRSVFSEDAKNVRATLSKVGLRAGMWRGNDWVPPDER